MCHHGESHFGQYASAAMLASAASDPRYATLAAISAGIAGSSASGIASKA
jgi:hypothetical protein